MRTIFLFIKATAGGALFLLLLEFAVKNLDNVAVRYFLGLEWQAPLAVVLLIFFIAGIVLGVMPSLAIMGSQRREILRLKRELRSLTRGPVPSLIPEPV